mmetsp:Transcript_18660/g.30661  ORF Transcript_18660/g.30661 Transcript_18660/m.30661 type:complete len:273 (-) Transcript_18660:128-946(-)
MLRCEDTHQYGKWVVERRFVPSSSFVHTPLHTSPVNVDPIRRSSPPSPPLSPEDNYSAVMSNPLSRRRFRRNPVVIQAISDARTAGNLVYVNRNGKNHRFHPVNVSVDGVNYRVNVRKCEPTPLPQQRYLAATKTVAQKEHFFQKPEVLQAVSLAHQLWEGNAANFTTDPVRGCQLTVWSKPPQISVTCIIEREVYKWRVYAHVACLARENKQHMFVQCMLCTFEASHLCGFLQCCYRLHLTGETDINNALRKQCHAAGVCSKIHGGEDCVV